MLNSANLCVSLLLIGSFSMMTGRNFAEGQCANDPKWDRMVDEYLKGVGPSVSDEEVEDFKITDVRFYLYTPENPKEAQEMNIEDMRKSKFNTKRKTIFIIHGYVEDPKWEEWQECSKDELLKYYPNFNIIIVAYGQGGASVAPYPIAVYLSYRIAAIVARFILCLREAFRYSVSNVMIVGFSLGGQIAGNAGYLLIEYKNVKIQIIIALDPAGPEFRGKLPSLRLDKSDAKCVHVFHTDDNPITGFGHFDPCGHLDFYPNGGCKQPGCDGPEALMEQKCLSLSHRIPKICSHAKSIPYFVTTINPKNPICMGRLCQKATNCEFTDCYGGSCTKTTVNCFPITFSSLINCTQSDSTDSRIYYYDTNFKELYCPAKNASAGALTLA